MTKQTKWHVRPVKTQISLGIRLVWSESSLSTWRKLGSLATYLAHSEDSGQAGRMPRLIWVFVGRTCHFVGFVMRRLILRNLTKALKISSRKMAEIRKNMSRLIQNQHPPSLISVIMSAWRKFESLATHWAQSEDSDQTGPMPRLIWVFAGRTCHFVCFVMRQLILVDY